MRKMKNRTSIWGFWIFYDSTLFPKSQQCKVDSMRNYKLYFTWVQEEISLKCSVKRLIELTATWSHTNTASTPPDILLCSYKARVFLTSTRKFNISDRPINNNYIYSSYWNRNKSGTLMIQHLNVYFQRHTHPPKKKTHFPWSRICTWSCYVVWAKDAHLCQVATQCSNENAPAAKKHFPHRPLLQNTHLKLQQSVQKWSRDVSIAVWWLAAV